MIIHEYDLCYACKNPCVKPPAKVNACLNNEDDIDCDKFYKQKTDFFKPSLHGLIVKEIEVPDKEV